MEESSQDGDSQELSDSEEERLAERMERIEERERRHAGRHRRQRRAQRRGAARPQHRPPYDVEVLTEMADAQIDSVEVQRLILEQLQRMQQHPAATALPAAQTAAAPSSSLHHRRPHQAQAQAHRHRVQQTVVHVE